MAKKDAVLKGSKVSDEELLNLLDKLVEEGADEMALERHIWKADAVGRFPVVGFIIGLVEMPPADRKDNPDWKAFIVSLTHETRVLNRQKEIVVAKPGDEVIVPANFQLASSLARFALSPEMHEIGIQAKEKIDIGGGQSMWTFRVVKTKTQPKERGQAYALPEAVTKQLEGKEVATEAAPS